MARYMLFAGDDHYPLGGARDLAGGHNDLDAAIEAGKACGRDWWNVLDVRTGEFYYPAESAADEADRLYELTPEQRAEAVAERERVALATRASDVAFGERFDEVTGDPRAALERHCRLRGHKPVERGRTKRGDFLTCGCGSRMYMLTEDGYARVFKPIEAVTKRKKKGAKR